MLKDKDNLQLVSFVYLKEIKKMDEVEKIKKSLLSYTDNYLPIVNKDDESVELLNLKEIQKREGEESVSASIKLISEYLDRIVQPGIHTVQLTWKCRSKVYKSLCIVSDDTIVYDHVIMNLMLTKEEKTK